MRHTPRAVVTLPHDVAADTEAGAMAPTKPATSATISTLRRSIILGTLSLIALDDGAFPRGRLELTRGIRNPHGVESGASSDETQPTLRSRCHPVESSKTTAPARTIGLGGGCCTKPARKSSSALAEVHVRAAVRDDVGTDRPLATTGMEVFGAHP